MNEKLCILAVQLSLRPYLGNEQIPTTFTALGAPHEGRPTACGRGGGRLDRALPLFA